MKLKTLNHKIDSLNDKLRKIKIKKSSFNQAERKKRARNLIILGANFEILGYEKEETTVLLGFLKENLYLIESNREKYKKLGEELLAKRKEEKLRDSLKVTNNIEENRQINIIEIKELMEIAKDNNVAIFIKNNFNKTLWENLTLKEFDLLKKSFKQRNE